MSFETRIRCNLCGKFGPRVQPGCSTGGIRGPLVTSARRRGWAVKDSFAKCPECRDLSKRISPEKKKTT